MRNIKFLLIFSLLVTVVFAQTIQQGLDRLMDQFVKPTIPLVIGIAIALSAVVYAIGQMMGAETRAKATVWSTNLFIGTILAAVIYVTLMWLVSPNTLQSSLGSLPLFSNNVVNNVDFITVYILPSLAFAIGIIVVFYITAAIFQQPQIDAIKQEELAAFITTLLILALWGFLYFTMGNVTRSLLCTTTADLCTGIQLTANHIDISYYALEILFVKLRESYVQLYLFEILIGFLSTISFSIGSQTPGPNVISLSFNPFDGLVLLSSAHTVVVEAIGYAMMVIMAKEHLLRFARDAIPTVLLPIGILLRAFPFFRTSGSSLIAICIVGYFVYPLTLLLSNYLIFDIYDPPNFGHVPNVAGYVGAESLCDDDPVGCKDKINSFLEKKKNKAKETLEVFDNGEAVRQSIEEVCGSGLYSLWCDLKSIGNGLKDSFLGFIHTVKEITISMWEFGGDLLRSILYSFIPIGTAGGLYSFLVLEVVGVSQFVILVIFVSVIEIIITITMYRNIAGLIGGEMELAGLTKLV